LSRGSRRPSIVLATLTASAGDQEERVTARVNIIAAGRDATPRNLASIIDIASFFQFQT